MQVQRDQNRIAGKFGVLNTDGVTLVPISINETNGSVKVNSVDSISFTMKPISLRDENFKNTMLFIGSDGLTYPWVVDSEGKVLIDFI
jgi:hypothetical protein